MPERGVVPILHAAVESSDQPKRRSNMMSRFFVVAGLLVLATAGDLRAQATSQTRTAEAGIQVTQSQLTGVVVVVDGNHLVARMQPDNSYRVFDVVPGRKFMIDGQSKLIAVLKPGTTLTATVVTKTQPITVRTTTLTNGTVLFVSGNNVVVTLENGQSREYVVPDDFQFTVNGKPAGVKDLRKGLKVSATKIVESPLTEMSEETMVSGTAPK